VLDQSEAQDADSYNVTKEFSEKYNVTSLDDLKNVTVPLTVGANPEFETRPYGIPGLKSAYGVTATLKPISDSGGPLTVAALKNGDVQLADIYTTTPAIKDNGFVTLKDPKNLIAAQNIVPLINSKKASDKVKEVLNKVSKELTTEDLIDMNGENQGASKTQPDQVAKKWLQDHPIKYRSGGPTRGGLGCRGRRVGVCGLHVPRLPLRQHLLDDEDRDEEQRDHRDEDVARPVELAGELAIASGRRRAHADVGERPQDAGRDRPRHECAVAHRTHTDGQRDEGVQHRQEPGQEHGDAAAAGEVGLGAVEVADADPAAEGAGADPRPEEAAEREADRLAAQRTDDHGYDEGDVLDRARHPGARDQDDGVAGDDQPDQDRRLQHDREPGQQRPQHRVDALDQVEDPGEGVVHVVGIRRGMLEA
jgi:hypothetical protein